MATIEFGDFDAYQKALESLYKDTEGIVKQAIYKGAGIVADEIKNNLEALPIQEGKKWLAAYRNAGKSTDRCKPQAKRRPNKRFWPCAD